MEVNRSDDVNTEEEIREVGGDNDVREEAIRINAPNAIECTNLLVHCGMN